MNNECREDVHRFGAAATAGAGIARSVCGRCGQVMLTLTDAPDLNSASNALFGFGAALVGGPDQDLQPLQA